MDKKELKELVKSHFNLVDAKENASLETFATATLEDGTKITNDKGTEFADGDKVFVEVDGEKKPAPEGDHITESGITITLDAESIITGMKRPDEAGEGSEGLKEEEDMKTDKEEMSTEEVFEEEIIEEEKMEEMPSLEEIVGVIAEVVDEKMMEIKEKMGKMEEKMGEMEEKMSAFSAEPAEEKTIGKAFSKAPIEVNQPRNAKRYNKLLAKVSKSI